MDKILILLLISILFTSCNQPDLEVNEADSVSDYTSIESTESDTEVIDTIVVQEEAAIEIVEDVTASVSTTIKDDTINEPSVNVKIIEEFTSVDELLGFYFEYGAEGLYGDEISSGFYHLYKELEFSEFVKSCSRYSHTIENKISSYLIYGLITYDGSLESLKADLESLESTKVYSYFTERLIEDSAGDNIDKLNLKDDVMEYPEHQEIEAGIAESNTIDELVELSFIYPIDGAYAEAYSGRVKKIYDSIGLEELVDDCCMYGEVIQGDFAFHLAYGISYFEEELIVLEEGLKSIDRDRSNDYFLGELERWLSSW